MSRVRARIYDALVADMTADWYRAVFERLPEHCRLLDIGIGTGRALVQSADEIARKSIRVTGIDIDPDYIAHCRREVTQRALDDRVEVRLESVYDHRGGPYDAAYFSGSFMLLPDPPGALRHVRTLLRVGGRVYFTQTFEQRRARALEVFKPLLRLVTTIDFGRVTYEAEFREALADGGLVLEELAILKRGPRRSSVLVVALTEGTWVPSGAHPSTGYQ